VSDRLLDVTATAKRIGFPANENGKRMVRNLIYSGMLKAENHSSGMKLPHWYVRQSEVDRYVKRAQERATEELEGKVR
jgi:hypothetical protein